VVLEHGEAPPEFVHSVRLVESERAARRAQLAAVLARTDVRQTTLYRAVPRLAAGVKVERKPVVAEGEFVWGYTLTTAGYPEGTPCSRLVARLVSLIDGRTPTADLLNTLGAGRELSERASIERSALAALQILYVDGTIADLLGL
jgi:hypothetical protein